MRRYNKQRKVMLLIIMLLAVTVGFAILSTTLKINGLTGIKSNTWDIHWDGTTSQVTEGSVTTTKPTVGGTNNDTVSFSVNLELPGDFYEFTIDAVNAGTIDGALSILPTIDVYDENEIKLTGDDIPDYINFSVKYADGTDIAAGDVLKATKSKKYRVRIEIDEDAENLPSINKTYTYKYDVNYEQYKSVTPTINSSWNNIIDGYNQGKIEKLEEDMENGTTRDIDLGSLGVHPVRIVNLTPCSEVEVTSKSACGLVMEFADIITEHRMNPRYVDGAAGTGNKGGWEYSDMRAYLNSTVYAYENINYSTTGIYSYLPSNLRSKIIDTTMISSHGSYDTSNFTTTDKLYLFAEQEIQSYSNSGYSTMPAGATRQLDYYRINGVTNLYNSWSSSVEKSFNNDNNHSDWFLRSVSRDDYYAFQYIDYHILRGCDSYTEYGVSPAFRLAE